ncbi:MAG: hypothetical protein PHQ86_07690 [Dehalococcoidales bacterium]|nr:hypothetical protein [Dehalococcoidales bacterium]
MKLRLIFRKGIADADGRYVGYDYITHIIDIPDDAELARLEVIGGEWLEAMEVDK